MASTSRPRVSQISWPVPTSVAIAAKRIGSSSIATPPRSLLELAASLSPRIRPEPREAEIEIAEHAAPGQAARPVLQHVETAGGMTAADHGADRGADDDVRDDAFARAGSDHADMGKSARGAAAERQPDRRPLRARAAWRRAPLSRRGRRFVHVPRYRTPGFPIVAARQSAARFLSRQCRNAMTQIAAGCQALPPPGGRVIVNTVSTTAYSS